jgi:Raf kinase inhibitor-like YbhB/YbcL family protein
MSMMDKAKRMIGKAMSPLHAGEEKLLTHRKEICGEGVQEAPRRIEVHSDAFADHAAIPVKYSAEGSNVSPPLRWSGVPGEAKELVLVCEDPDAPMPPPFVHWVVRGLKPEQSELPEGVARTKQPEDLAGAVQGQNSRKEIGYMGPMPPKGHGQHHYHFELFALDRPLQLDVETPPDRDALMKAMQGHVLAYGEVVGVYERT